MPQPPRRADSLTSDRMPSSGDAVITPDAETVPVDAPWHVRDTNAVASVIPLADRHADEVATAGAADAGDQRVPDTADGNGPGRLRARDVWAAARARRRALQREVRRFTARQRRRRRVWIASASALVALVLGSLGAAYSPLFSVERITVVGTSTLDVAAVETALAPQLGTPLPLIDESEIKAALVGFPLVESYALEARPPHELVIRVVERTPVGAVQGDAGFTLVDAAGVALSTTPEAPAGYPLLEVDGGPASSAFAAAGQVFRSLPESLRAQVATLSATTANDVTLTLADGRVVVWGGAVQAAKKARILEGLMVSRADAGGYDVSSPDAAVVR